MIGVPRCPGACDNACCAKTAAVNAFPQACRAMPAQQGSNFLGMFRDAIEVHLHRLRAIAHWECVAGIAA